MSCSSVPDVESCSRAGLRPDGRCWGFRLASRNIGRWNPSRIAATLARVRIREDPWGIQPECVLSGASRAGWRDWGANLSVGSAVGSKTCMSSCQLTAFVYPAGSEGVRQMQSTNVRTNNTVWRELAHDHGLEISPSLSASQPNSLSSALSAQEGPPVCGSSP